MLHDKDKLTTPNALILLVADRDFVGQGFCPGPGLTPVLVHTLDLWTSGLVDRDNPLADNLRAANKMKIKKSENVKS